MAVIVNFELVKGNAEHAAKVRSRSISWKAWHKQRQLVALGGLYRVLTIAKLLLSLFTAAEKSLALFSHVW